jgi:hypothetical protein
MKILYLSAALILVLVSTSVARAQVCPAEVQVAEAVPVVSEGWQVSRELVASKLNGLEIVEGKLHLKASDNAILKPNVAPTGEYIWQFREQIGKAEVWMQCVYKGTQVRLFRRVDPSVNVCREKRIQGKKRDENSVVQAECR